MVSLNSSLLVLGSFSADFFPSTNISIFNRFTIIAPPSSRPFTITVTTYYQQAGSTYGIDTLTKTYGCLPGTMTAALTLADTAIGASTSLVITVTIQNSLYSGSYIGVSFPAGITATVGNTCSSNSSSLSCTVTASNYANLTSSALVAGASVIDITFSAVQNPG